MAGGIVSIWSLIKLVNLAMICLVSAATCRLTRFSTMKKTPMFRTAFAICMIVSLSLMTAAARAAGCAVPIGGALKADNTEVWSRLVTLSGGKGSKWLVVPTASATPEKSAAQIIHSLEKHGATAEMIPLSDKLASFKMVELVRDPAWITKVNTAKGIYFAGGAQERITTALFDKESLRTPMLAAIWQMFEEGGVVAGSSAGAAIMSETMFREPPEILTIMKSGAKRGRDIDRGLGFVGGGLFVDQHFLKRGRIGRMLPVMAQEGIKLGLGIEENSAAIICGDDVEVIGGKGALLVDLRNANTSKAFQPFRVSGAMLTYLDHGDRINLKTFTVTPSASKLKGNKIDPSAANSKPYNNNVRFYADMLGDNTIVNAMSALLDSPAEQTLGLAFAPDKGAASGIGFEFRLYKANGTHGYFSTASGGENYTVIRMGLDVKPVRLANPLYSPLSEAADAGVSVPNVIAGENTSSNATPVIRPVEKTK